MAVSTRFIRRCVLVVLLGLACGWAKDVGAVTIAWSPVGNAGNAADPLTGFGAVGYDYKIGAYDVTNAQYTEFLNAKDPNGANTLGLYDTLGRSLDPTDGIDFLPGNGIGAKYVVTAGLGNRPVNNVSWYDAVRFSNWINNGQGNADTETGAYTLLGGTSLPSNGATIVRNSAARIALPSENEWYKAAYFDPTSHSFFKYPTASNSAPLPVAPPGGPNSGNFNGAVGTRTDVGAYTLSGSPSHTFDQGGNVNQWIESLADSGNSRIYRGGSYFIGSGGDLLSSVRHSFDPGGTASLIGFRLAMVPEPSTCLLAVIGGLILLARRRPIP